MINPGMMSSKSGFYGTPPEVFGPLDSEFGFDLDACATSQNAKCDRYYTPADDGLTQPWQGVVWVNPPYGRSIHKWVRKAYESSRAGATVVCLLPARTDTRWFHEFAVKGEVRFLPGRIYFLHDGIRDRAPFPSMVVVFRDGGRVD